MKKWNRNVLPLLVSDLLKIRIETISKGAKNASIALKRSTMPMTKEKVSLFGLNLPMVELVTTVRLSMNHNTWGASRTAMMERVMSNSFFKITLLNFASSKEAIRTAKIKIEKLYLVNIPMEINRPSKK